jgi:hypothetical protein
VDGMKRKSRIKIRNRSWDEDQDQDEDGPVAVWALLRPCKWMRE